MHPDDIFLGLGIFAVAYVIGKVRNAENPLKFALNGFLLTIAIIFVFYIALEIILMVQNS